jgi:hypothetical protein
VILLYGRAGRGGFALHRPAGSAVFGFNPNSAIGFGDISQRHGAGAHWTLRRITTGAPDAALMEEAALKTNVPEPGTYGLFSGVFIAGMVFPSRRRKKK